MDPRFDDVIPLLACSDIAAEHDFLVRVLGFASAGGGIVVHVPDVDAHYERAREAGAEILSPPTDQDYGQREYGVRDPEGHSWWIATPDDRLLG